MEETRQNPNEPVQPITPEQAAEIAGGDGDCTSSTITVGNTTVESSGTLSDVAIATYEATVDLTSHIIERVNNAI